MTVAPELVILWAGLFAAVLTDTTTGKIPNWLTGSMMVLGMATHWFIGAEPWAGVLGWLAAVALHFSLWMLGVVKAGDAKLMMGVGACVGVAEMLETTAWWMILYIPVGLLILTIRGRLGNLVAVAKHLSQKATGQPVGEPPELTIAIAGPVIGAAGFMASVTDLIPIPLP